MLITDDIELRLARAEDAQALTDALVRNREHMRPWEPYRDEGFYTAAAQTEQIVDASRVTWLLFDGERVAGRISLQGVVRGPLCSASLGYWTDADYLGRGLMPRAVEEVCRIARDELGLHRVEAGTITYNEASQRVLAKCGFVQYGLAPKFLHIDGAWRDHVLFQRILHDDPPPHVPK